MSIQKLKEGEEFVWYGRKSYQRVKLQMIPVGESKTRQSFKKETDVKEIIKKYVKTGILDTVKGLEAFYGDFTQVNDYQSALQASINASEAFMDLPSPVRKRFNNNPDELIEFLSDDKNYEEAMEYNLLDPKRTQAYLDNKKAIEDARAKEAADAKAAATAAAQ